jgi:hypothetical protein
MKTCRIRFTNAAFGYKRADSSEVRAFRIELLRNNVFNLSTF